MDHDKNEFLGGISIKNLFKSLERDRINRRLQNAKTFREYMMYKVIFGIRPILNRHNVLGPSRTAYFNFAKKFGRLFWRDLFPLMRLLKPEEIKEKVDLILDYLEAFDIPRYRLNPQIIAEIEEYLINTVRDIPNLFQEFENLHSKQTEEEAET